MLPLVHLWGVEGLGLVNHMLDLRPGFYGCWDVDEVGWVEIGFHGEGEPLVVGFWRLFGDGACEFDVIWAATVDPAHDL